VLYIKPSGLLPSASPVKKLLVAVFVLTGLSGCIPPSLPDIRSDIENRDQLKVGIQYAPARFEIGPQGNQGFDYELVAGFAEHLNVELALIPYFDTEAMEKALNGNHIDLIVPGGAYQAFATKHNKQGPHYLETAWQLNATQDDSLQAALFDYFNDAHQQGIFDELHARYMTAKPPLTEPDIAAIVNQAIEAEGELYAHFDSVAGSVSSQISEQTSRTLLAALTFQLNRWQNKTSNLADAKRFATIMVSIPNNIPPEERVSMALAAFYSGIPHLLDARRLTREQGGNENSWIDVQLRYPALEDSDVYRHLNAGYVNGTNTIKFVSNVHDYQRALVALEAQ